MGWQQYQHESTADLIEYMRWQDDRDIEMQQTAKEAFSAFCFRFQKDIISKCRVLARSYSFIEEVGDSISEKVFYRFWRYGCKKFVVSTPDVDKRVKYYLYRIAERAMIDYKAEQAVGRPYTGEEEIVEEFPILDTEGMPVEKRGEIKKRQEIVERALNSLSPKHRVVYLTYLIHQKDGHNLPRPLLEKLRKALELTQNSVGVYKKEAFDTVKLYLELYG